MDESDATERLTVLLDAGYEGRLMTSESNGRLVFTLEVGPFEDLWDADRAAEALDESYGFDSSVTVLRGDEP